MQPSLYYSQFPGRRCSIIDGKNITDLLTGTADATTPHEQFFYYSQLTRSLDAVRAGKWKLHLEKNELYDLQADVGETTNLYEQEPTVVAELRDRADACRDDIGDPRTNIEGKNRRPVGRVSNPQTLLPLPEDDLWVRAVYD